MSINQKFTLLLITVTILIVAGCDKRPEGVLSDSEMTDLMKDLVLADALEQSSSYSNLPDSVRRNLGESILRQHGVDRATLDSTFAWYSRNIDDYYRLYAKVDKRLKKMKKQITPDNNEIEIGNNIWDLPSYIRFSKFSSGEAVTFQLPGDAVAGGEELRWKMYLDPNSSADLMLGIDYENGTSSYTRKDINGGKIELSVVADTALRATRIYGFIWPNMRNNTVWVDSISLLKMPFDSTTYKNSEFRRKITPPRRIEIKKDTAGNVSTDISKEIRERKEKIPHILE